MASNALAPAFGEVVDYLDRITTNAGYIESSPLLNFLAVTLYYIDADPQMKFSLFQKLIKPTIDVLKMYEKCLNSPEAIAESSGIYKIVSNSYSSEHLNREKEFRTMVRSLR